MLLSRHSVGTYQEKTYYTTGTDRRELTHGKHTGESPWKEWFQKMLRTLRYQPRGGGGRGFSYTREHCCQHSYTHVLNTDAVVSSGAKMGDASLELWWWWSWEEEVGRQHQGMDRPEGRQVPEGSGEQRKMGESGCQIICGAPTTLANNPRS